MKGNRQSTVEPVFGTLTQFMGLRKINTIGLEQANKVMRLSAIAYNLKRYLKFTRKRVKSGVGQLAFAALLKSTVQFLLGASVKHRKSVRIQDSLVIVRFGATLSRGFTTINKSIRVIFTPINKTRVIYLYIYSCISNECKFNP